MHVACKQAHEDRTQNWHQALFFAADIPAMNLNSAEVPHSYIERYIYLRAAVMILEQRVQILPREQATALAPPAPRCGDSICREE